MYTRMVLKRSDQFRWAWIHQNVRYSMINDENKFNCKDHLIIYFQNNNNGKWTWNNLLYNFYFRQNGYRPSLFLQFYPFSFTHIFFLPCLFHFCCIWTERAHSFLTTYLGGTFSALLDISEWNFFPRLGGGVHVHTVHPLRTRPGASKNKMVRFAKKSWDFKKHLFLVIDPV